MNNENIETTETTETTESSVQATLQGDTETARGILAGDSPKQAARKARKAGTSGKRINGATANMPEVKRIEGKSQCRVVATDSKGRILRVGKAEVSTPVRNSTPDKAAAIIGFQKRAYFGRKGSAPDTFKAMIEKTAGVRFVLQWLTGEKWIDHKAPSQ